MTKAEAAERIRKLEALGDPSRGGSPAERDLARAKARELRTKFRIVDPIEGVARTRAAPRRPTPAWTAPTTGAAWGFIRPEGAEPWDFNMDTGEAVGPVKVHHHNHRGDWKIEIDPIDTPGRRALDERERRRRRLG